MALLIAFLLGIFRKAFVESNHRVGLPPMTFFPKVPPNYILLGNFSICLPQDGEKRITHFPGVGSLSGENYSNTVFNIKQWCLAKKSVARIVCCGSSLTA